VPRDREGTFEPQFIPKHERRFTGFDDKILALYFAFPPDVRRLIYTTNALESVHARLRKIIKTRGHFPNDEAAIKLIWLALRNITAKWERVAYYWRPAMNQFAILDEGRFSPSTT
jgi:putative transposase